ncbi:MAG: universal stress protein [Magnetococcus sp. YQC-3]
MNHFSRIIAVVDLFSGGGEVIRVAIETAKRHAASLRLVTLFEHLEGSPGQGGGELSPEGRFCRNEAELQERLLRQATLMGAVGAECTVLTGHPGEALGGVASQWGADLILADRETARTIHNGWVPFFHGITPLPCKLVIVQRERTNLANRLLRLLRWPKSAAPTATASRKELSSPLWWGPAK